MAGRCEERRAEVSPRGWGGDGRPLWADGGKHHLGLPSQNAKQRLLLCEERGTRFSGNHKQLARLG